jgi:hypothetical protein
MPTSRATLVRGPAQLTFDGKSITTKDDIVLEIGGSSFDVVSSAFGKVDERVDDCVGKISFTPDGVWTADTILFMYPLSLRTPVCGSSMLTAVDKPLVITEITTGKIVTMTAACITKMPDMDLSAVKQPMGAMEFTCLRGLNTDWTGVGSFFTTAAGSGVPTITLGAIPTNPFACTWKAPLTGMQTMDGYKCSFSIKSQGLTVDAVGTIDLMLESVEATCRCTPVPQTGLLEPELLGAMLVEAGGGRGKSYAALGADLILVGGIVSMTLKSCFIRKVGLAWGASKSRFGEIEFVATRATGGVLFTPAIV